MSVLRKLTWVLFALCPQILGPDAYAQAETQTQQAQAAESAAGRPSAFQVLLNEGKRLSAQGKYYDAAIVFHKILTEAQESDEWYQEAQYEMGVALYNLGLYVSSFGFFDRVAERGEEHIRYRQALPWLIRIHRLLPGERTTLLRMASYPADAYPPDMVDELLFYLGQYYYYEGNLAKALESLERISKNAPLMYVKGMYLKGVTHVRLNQTTAALQAFTETLQFVQANRATIPGAEYFEEMATIGLARILYGAGRYEEAVGYYDRIPDTSEVWLDSLFERAWAYFQMGNYSRALGSIHTVSSPYFAEEFYPEVYVLKSVILFMNCHYDAALETIDPFYKEYYEVMKELERAVKGHGDPASFYNYLAAISVKGGQYSLKVKKIFNAALADRRVRSLFEFVVQINREMQQIEELRKHPVAKQLADFLAPDILAFRELTKGEAGRLAYERLLRVHKELKGLLSQSLRVRFEALNAQKGIMGSSAPVEALGSPASVEEVQADYEHIVWPFDGEYWKDELGSYYYPLESRCVKK